MVRVAFDTRSVGYDDHFIQRGSGGASDEDNGPLAEPYRYFHGSMPFQRGFGARQSGAGIGDVLRHLWRIIMPVVRRAGTAVGREALSTGGKILDRVAQGDPLKQAVTSEGKRGIDTLLEKGGMPKQFGTGKRCKKAIKSRLKRLHPSHQTIIGRTVIKPPILPNRKRQRSDTFGLY